MLESDLSSDEVVPEGKLISVSSPKLSAVDKLYVRAYLSTLSHVKAHKVASPTLKSHHADNQFSRKDAIQFHISLGLQESFEAISLSPELIIAKLYKEATREGGGSNHAARVTALTTIGKQLGMFQEKREAIVPTIHIINYNPTLSLSNLPSSKELLEISSDDTEEIDLSINQVPYEIIPL
jgi:hypothetical protein